MTKTQIEIAQKIGQFYLEKWGDSKKANEEIYKLGVTNIYVQGKSIYVILGRPGLLLGKGGKNIEKLQEYLDCSIYIIEDTLRITDYMYVYDY